MYCNFTNIFTAQICSVFKFNCNFAFYFQLIPDPEFLKLLKAVGAASNRILKGFEIYTVQQVRLCDFLPS